VHIHITDTIWAISGIALLFVRISLYPASSAWKEYSVPSRSCAVPLNKRPHGLLQALPVLAGDEV